MAKFLSEYYKRFYLFIGLMVLLLGVGLAGYLIINNYTNKALKEIVTNKTTINAHSQLLDVLKTLENDYNQVKDDFNILYSHLPSSAELINFTPKLKELASKNHLDIGVNLTVENPISAEEPKSYNFTLYLSGRLSQLKSYFKDMADLGYFIRFDQVEVNYLEGEGENASYRFNILGRVYGR